MGVADVQARWQHGGLGASTRVLAAGSVPLGFISTTLIAPQQIGGLNAVLLALLVGIVAQVAAIWITVRRTSKPKPLESEVRRANREDEDGR